MSEAVRAEAKSKPADTSQTVVVKKYANRRLYNTESSSYITLDNLAKGAISWFTTRSPARTSPAVC
jgi:hypothetical protein